VAIYFGAFVAIDGLLGLSVLAGFLSIRLVARMPAGMTYPLIFVTCCVAVYATRQAFFDMIAMTAFGALGYLMKRFGMSTPAFVIAFILGPGLERSMRQSFLLDESGGWIFLERPVALCFFAAGLIVLALRLRPKSLSGPEPATSQRLPHGD
jgi:putative tricarboxylic transport membrane protein